MSEYTIDGIEMDADTAVHHLARKQEKLRQELAAVTRERDIAVADTSDLAKVSNNLSEAIGVARKEIIAVTAERNALVTWKQTLAAGIAERDDTIIALKSKLDAVPVEAIRVIYEELAYDDLGDDIGDELDAVKDWLETQVTQLPAPTPLPYVDEEKDPYP